MGTWRALVMLSESEDKTKGYEKDRLSEMGGWEKVKK